MKKIFLFIFVIVVFLLISCGSEPPYISSCNSYIVIYQQDSVVNMLNDNVFLSVYCVVASDNDENDITQMKVTHVNSEYSWIIEAKNLSTYLYKDTSYIGFPFIEYDDGKSVLLGDYVIEIVDKTDNVSDYLISVKMPGYSDKNIFTIDNTKIPYSPKMIRNNKELVIESINKEQYNSVEIQFENNRSFFNGGRKKFNYGEKIIFDSNYLLDENTKISVRLNYGEEDNIVYFLRPIKIDVEQSIVE